MIALNICDIKKFMQAMLTGELFDSFLMVEGEINVAINYKLEGRINKGFFSDEGELEMRQEEYIKWTTIKGNILQLIKGKRLPVSMKFVLTLSNSNTEGFLNKSLPGMNLGDVKGLYINIRYEKEALCIITGASRASFSLDKTLENEWDKVMMRFFVSKGIAYEKV